MLFILNCSDGGWRQFIASVGVHAQSCWAIVLQSDLRRDLLIKFGLFGQSLALRLHLGYHDLSLDSLVLHLVLHGGKFVLAGRHLLLVPLVLAFHLIDPSQQLIDLFLLSQSKSLLRGSWHWQ